MKYNAKVTGTLKFTREMPVFAVSAEDADNVAREMTEAYVSDDDEIEISSVEIFEWEERFSIGVIKE